MDFGIAQLSLLWMGFFADAQNDSKKAIRMTGNKNAQNDSKKYPE
ncbi:MAG TPA: hypothetical protein PK138_02400 [Candidatus Paceibacterota bacterium]|jgi:hypothetical protein|nr:hypothetical protein [Candidatus Paceibacterota bacterium]